MAKKQNKIALAVIGGSGVYSMEELKNVREVAVKTPFGAPSDKIISGVLEGVPVAFLPRHGRGHRLNPSEVNYRANIYGLKLLGVEQIISVSACGSLREDLRPQDMVFPDQIFDRTKSRASTFFEKGLVAHVGIATPYCAELSGRQPPLGLQFQVPEARLLRQRPLTAHPPSVAVGALLQAEVRPEVGDRAEDQRLAGQAGRGRDGRERSGVGRAG